MPYFREMAYRDGMKSHAHVSELARLSETDLILADAGQDIRNRVVIDRHGAEIGKIDDLFIDESERKVRMVQIRAGGFLRLGERHFLLPVDAITDVTAKEIYVNVTLEHVVGSLPYDPKLIELTTRDTIAPYYGHFAINPYWATGYMYPRFPSPEDSDPRDRYVR